MDVVIIIPRYLLQDGMVELELLSVWSFSMSFPLGSPVPPNSHILGGLATQNCP